MTAIEFNNISKQYRLGLVSTRTLSHDLNRWWTMNIRGKEDPYLKIGDTNDRSTKGESDYVWALRDIDFKVEQGDVLGIIGKNGAGKSTLLKILSKVTTPTTGTIKARGRIASLLEVGTGFHPEMTGRENIYMNGAIMGMTKAEISRKLDEIVDFSGVERYIDTPTKRYSSGMTVRLGFAIAAHLDPEILVVDEVLAVGDAEFQKKAIGKMQDVSRGEGRTVLFVSHNMPSIQKLCSSCVLLKDGMVSTIGQTNSVIDLYLREQNKLGYYDRKGSGKLRFVSHKLSPDIISVGEGIEIEFSIQVNAHIDKVMFHVNLYSDEENWYAQVSSEDDDFALANADLGETRTIKCKIPYINAAPGRYYLNLWAGNAFEEYDWLQHCMEITIGQGDTYIKRVTTYPNAAMVLKSEWK